jgi:hypothetical protein
MREWDDNVFYYAIGATVFIIILALMIYFIKRNANLKKRLEYETTQMGGSFSREMSSFDNAITKKVDATYIS